MAITGVEVATIVASIISAYGNGVDVLRRLTGRKAKRRGREPTPSEEDEWLRESLERRPMEIRNTYNRNVARLGCRFEAGDAAAHSSLAHTLLLLNTGLIKLINHALSRDDDSKAVSKRSLLHLSEAAAADTLHALSQLSLRLDQRPQLPAIVEKLNHEQAEPRAAKTSQRQAIKQKMRPAPSPLLVRGGWVRSKSGSSVVTIQSVGNRNKSALSKHQRSKSEPGSVPNSKTLLSTAVSKPQPNRALQQNSEGFVHQGIPTEEASIQSRPQRQPSMLLVPADFFDAHVSAQSEPPPRPPKVPLHTRPNVVPRQRPQSSATFLTVSTKIGEISVEAETKTYERDRERNVYAKTPYNLPAPLEVDTHQPKSRNRGLRFWKRVERE